MFTIFLSVWGMILQWGSTIKVNTELPAATRHHWDMTEKPEQITVTTTIFLSVLMNRMSSSDFISKSINDDKKQLDSDLVYAISLESWKLARDTK